MQQTVLVAGTWAWRNNNQAIEWFMPGSQFSEFLQAEGIQTVNTPSGQPFIWSTDPGGIGFGSGDLAVWAAAGWNLFWFCVPPRCEDKRIPGAELNLICHSHALQVGLYAFAVGLKGSLISVGSPVRKDMRKVAEAARPNIRYWLHIHSDDSDRMQWLGTLFDGQLGIVRKHPLADLNDFVPGVGHSKILRDPQAFSHWKTRGWLERLR